MSSPDSWASFIHVGFDTTVNIMKLHHQLYDKKLDQVVQSSSPERFPLVTAETLDNKGNSNNSLILPILEGPRVICQLLNHSNPVCPKQNVDYYFVWCVKPLKFI